VVNIAARHNINISGRPDGQPILFAHGFGCDQNMWRYVVPRFEDEFRVVLFDHIGAGNSDPSAYDPQRYSSLSGYAEDVVAICTELELRDAVFVGHSVSAMIGVLAAAAAPDLFAKLVLVGPSPRYVNDDDYVGGFSADDINDMLESLESNYLGWSSAMAPVIMGRADRPKLGEELTESFCRTDPSIARQFARVTFLSDNRDDLPAVATPTLILQCANDVIAPVSVGEFVRDRMPNASMVLLNATGHCPNLSAPEETATAIEQFVRRSTLAPR
jgi:sigma-B regulation protein RsbQ